MENDMEDAAVSDVLELIDAEPGDCARRLEEALTGLDLAAVIAALATIGGRPDGGLNDGHESTAEDALAWLGDDAPAVLDGGLSRLPAAKLRELLTSPARLAGLQEVVLSRGGPHWNAVIRRNAATGEIAARQRRAFAARPGRGLHP